MKLTITTSIIKELSDFLQNKNTTNSKFIGVDTVTIAAVAEVTDVTTPADVSDSLDGKHWLLDSPTIGYYVWYDTPGGAGDPLVTGRTAISVTIATNETAINVAILTAAAIDLVADFTVPVPTTSTLTITQANKGVVFDAVDVDAGVTVSVTTEGLDGDFKVEAVEIQNYLIDKGQSASFSLDLFDTIKIDKVKATFLHIFCYDVSGDENSVPEGINFRLKMGAVVIGRMSQFQMVNLSNYNLDIVADQIIVNTGKVANLVVIVGSKF